MGRRGPQPKRPGIVTRKTHARLDKSDYSIVIWCEDCVGLWSDVALSLLTAHQIRSEHDLEVHNSTHGQSMLSAYLLRQKERVILEGQKDDE